MNAGIVGWYWAMYCLAIDGVLMARLYQPWGPRDLQEDAIEKYLDREKDQGRTFDSSVHRLQNIGVMMVMMVMMVIMDIVRRYTPLSEKQSPSYKDIH